MKKLYLLSLTLLTALTTAAQQPAAETCQFVSADGTVVENGATVTLSELEIDDFDSEFISTGLFVKNNAEGETLVRVAYNITAIDNGTFQICFPSSCVTRSASGSYVTNEGTLTGGSVSDLQCEWLPAAYGSCTATLTIEFMEQQGFFPRYTYNKIGEGATVNVVFSYRDPAGIATTKQGEAARAAAFDLSGRRIIGKAHGLRLQRTADGKVRKVAK